MFGKPDESRFPSRLRKQKYSPSGKPRDGGAGERVEEEMVAGGDDDEQDEGGIDRRRRLNESAACQPGHGRTGNERVAKCMLGTAAYGL